MEKITSKTLIHSDINDDKFTLVILSNKITFILGWKKTGQQTMGKRGDIERYILIDHRESVVGRMTDKSQ